MIPLKEKISNAEELTNTNPTEGQKVGGNYQKGKVMIKGLRVSIENPIGSIRSGFDKQGKQWNTKMPYTYGYFNGTVGKDGDPIDVYLGPIVDQDFDVYIIDQIDEVSKGFDEHKVMFGYRDISSAQSAYMTCYTKDWKGFGSITAISLNKFKDWIKNSDMIKYPANRISMSKKVNYANYMDTANQRTVHIKMIGVVEEDVTLQDLKKQAGDISLFDTLICEIASPGGSVSEGLLTMVWLDSLSQMGKKIVTVVSANAYSIASLIMLAADIKIISRYGKVMVHNPMMPELKYANANELEQYAVELRALESVMYELYQIFTGLNREQIKALMDNETYLTPQQAVDNGFADVVADIKQRSYEMTANNKKEINMSKTLNILNRVIGMVNKSAFINQIYYDDKGGEIEVFQNDPSTYTVGDRTNLNEGIVKLSDGSVLTIKDSEIKEIGKATEAIVDPNAPIVDPNLPIDPSAEFNVGPAPKSEELELEIKVPETEVPAPMVPTAEMPMADPNKQKGDMPASVIETTESVTTTKETVAMAEPKVMVDKMDEPKVMIDPAVEPVVAPIVESVMDPKPSSQDDMKAMLEHLQSMVESLTKQVYGLAQNQVAIDTKFKEIKNFEDIAAEAIDALASSTVSNFKPSARSAVQSVSTGSIFQNLKQKRGL